MDRGRPTAAASRSSGHRVGLAGQEAQHPQRARRGRDLAHGQNLAGGRARVAAFVGRRGATYPRMGGPCRRARRSPVLEVQRRCSVRDCARRRCCSAVLAGDHRPLAGAGRRCRARASGSSDVSRAMTARGSTSATGSRTGSRAGGQPRHRQHRRWPATTTTARRSRWCCASRAYAQRPRCHAAVQHRPACAATAGWPGPARSCAAAGLRGDGGLRPQQPPTRASRTASSAAASTSSPRATRSSPTSGNRSTDFVGGDYERAYRLPNYGNQLT